MPSTGETTGDGRGFSGEVADQYARYRRGYPPAVVDALVAALRLTPKDTVIDLGCGTGQLSLPLAGRVGRVIGVDPEPDMLQHARKAAARRTVGDVQWTVGTAADLTRLAASCGGVDAITVANAIHLIDRSQLFVAAKTALRPGRGLAIIANGLPLWLQDATWSRRLRAFLQDWLGTTLSDYCGTDDATRSVYQGELTAMGYHLDEVRVQYDDVLDVKQVLGGVLSAMSGILPVAASRERFASQLGLALAESTEHVEHVDVRALIATIS